MTTDTNDDPEGVFTPTEAALHAMARKTLLPPASWTPEQIADAREGARLEYAAQAEYLLKMRTSTLPRLSIHWPIRAAESSLSRAPSSRAPWRGG